MDGRLSLFEVDSYIRQLRPFPISDVGSDPWMHQHDLLEKLNIQAHLDAATSKHDEIVVEGFCNASAPSTSVSPNNPYAGNKIALLIHELVQIDTWKEYVLPKLIEKIAPITAVKMYMVLYHEATLCNLLEVLLFHPKILEFLLDGGPILLSCTNLGLASASKANGEDALLELVGFLTRRIWGLANSQLKYKNILDPDRYDLEQDQKRKNIASKNPKPTGLEDPDSPLFSLTRQRGDLEFAVGNCCISLVRFLLEGVPKIHIGVTNKMVRGSGLLGSLCQILRQKPWERRREKKSVKSSPASRGEVVTEKFIDSKWMIIPEGDKLMLTKAEGQLWMSVYSFLFQPICRKILVNELSSPGSSVKDSVLALKPQLTETLLDQLPFLKELKRFLEELLILPSHSTSSSGAGSLFTKGEGGEMGTIIETIPEISVNMNEYIKTVAKKELGKTAAAAGKPKKWGVEDFLGPASTATASSSLSSSSSSSSSPTDRDWSCVACFQFSSYFCDNESTRQKEMARLAKTYNLDMFEEALQLSEHSGHAAAGKSVNGVYESGMKCGECHQYFTRSELKRCSRCRSEWYCSRPCQVKGWKKHQITCDLLFKEKKIRKEQEDKDKEEQKAQGNETDIGNSSSSQADSGATSVNEDASKTPAPAAAASALATGKIQILDDMD